MIYGQDAPVAIPVADLYDTGMMQMYVNAVRDQYQQGLKDYENFVAKYGDFTSPFAKDVDRWNNEVMGPTVNLIDALYAQGIDPMRNAEARAMIQRSVRNVPYAEAAKMRQNAAAGEAYLKARGALAAKGLYDKDYNDFWLAEQGYKPFEEWSSEDGIWNVTSPIEYKSLFDATSPWFEKMQKHDLTKEQVLAAKYPYDPKYRYTGIPVEDLQEVTGTSLPGFMNSFEGRYYRKRVADRLAAAGIEPTDDAVNEALANDIVTANHRVVVDPIAEEDKYALADYEAALKEKQAQKDHERNLELYGIRYGDDDGDGTGSSSSSSSGRGSGKGSKGHSHVFEMYTGGVAQVSGLTRDEVASDPQVTTMAFLNKQRSALRPTMGDTEVDTNNATAFMNSGAITEAPGTVVKMYIGKKPNANNVVQLDNNDVTRLSSARNIMRRAYGSNGTSGHIDKYTLVDGRTYGMQPTGKIKTVYEKDGRMRTYVEVNVYSYQNNVETDSTKKARQGELVNEGKVWYDTHITSRKKIIPKRQYGVDDDGTGYIKINGRKVMTNLPVVRGKVDLSRVPDVGYFPQEQIDLTPDSKYDLERESIDVALGRSMGDTASKNTSAARLD